MSMRSKLLTIAALILLTLSGCAREDANSDGNGPGNADGFGGRTDPPNTPASRDAAPGPLSETGAPSTSAEEERARTPERTADH
jgi:hypothetical protein